MGFIFCASEGMLPLFRTHLHAVGRTASFGSLCVFALRLHHVFPVHVPEG